MSEHREGEPEAGVSEPGDGLAPVIPLFGRHRSRLAVPPAPEPAASPPETPPGRTDGGAPGSAAVLRPEAAAWRSTWHGPPESAADSDAGSRPSGARDEVGDQQVFELAEKALLKKLRVRSLSVSEARGVL